MVKKENVKEIKECKGCYCQLSPYNPYFFCFDCLDGDNDFHCVDNKNDYGNCLACYGKNSRFKVSKKRKRIPIHWQRIVKLEKSKLIIDDLIENILDEKNEFNSIPIHSISRLGGENNK